MTVCSFVAERDAFKLLTFTEEHRTTGRVCEAFINPTFVRSRFFAVMFATRW